LPKLSEDEKPSVRQDVSITTKPLAGCGRPPEKLEALLVKEPEVQALYREATTAGQGRPAKEKTDIVSLKPKHGNSATYTLSRLKRERPDLFARVVAGELSANAAAIGRARGHDRSAESPSRCGTPVRAAAGWRARR
jgi:hypothetical protein